MIIGLIDVDGHHFPNLCLMKLSAYHKQLGDDVEWYSEDREIYDIVYMSKVFNEEYSPDIPEPGNARKVIKGGTGYAIKLEGDREVYHKELDPPYRLRLNTSILITVYILSILDMGYRLRSRRHTDF